MEVQNQKALLSSDETNINTLFEDLQNPKWTESEYIVGGYFLLLMSSVRY